MIVSSIGKIAEDLYCLGFAAIPVFLLDGPHPVLFDAGAACAGKIYADAIHSVLGRRQPEFLYLTHVHWDHCGSAYYLKKAFPDLKIAASPLAPKILNNPRAIALINRLNNDTREQIISFPGFDQSKILHDHFNPFNVEMLLSDDQVIDLGEGIDIQVLASPGHTRDHISYYIPSRKLLIGGEAIGELDISGNMQTLFVSAYNQYMSSLRRLAALPVEILCQGHLFVITGQEDIQSFFDRSIKQTESYKERIYQLLDENGGSIELVVESLAESYLPNQHIKQPETPYLLNTTAQVRHLASIR